MTTEAQQLLDAAFAGKLDLDADASQNSAAAAAAEGAAGQRTEEPKTNAANDKQAGAAAQDDEPAGAPIASKSGAYTIPYEKLTQARQERDTLKAENEQLKAQVTQLTAAQAQNLAAAQEQAQARADAGQAPTEADKNLAVAQAAAAQGVDMALFGDFSEESIANGVAALVEQRAAALVDARLKDALAPFQQREARSSADAHTQAIYAVHKDADEIYESAEFKKWMGEQPGYARAAIEHALANGEAPQVIEVFSTFKAATGKTAPADAVTKALEAVKVQPPASLSELPGAVGTSDAERVTALADDPAKLLDFMAGLSPEKQNRLMNSVV
ncbi:hypothetical protein [Alicycliphilus denitrificans]|uniref:hypothetical protein n=1 Tax=Alicycliphilus denitrificans TaxID=179636 RepID=UPI0002E47F3F|nr:hypothetical protein [Alicycliphilus denitrificans]